MKCIKTKPWGIISSEVILLKKERYDNLKQLLAENKSAYDFFSSLPQDIREKINQRNVSIQNEYEMRTYAEELLNDR